MRSEPLTSVVGGWGAMLAASSAMQIGATNMAQQVRVKQGIVRICRNFRTCLTIVRVHNRRITFRASEISIDRYGSQAVVHRNITGMSASGGKAVLRRPNFSSLRLNVRFSRKRSFRYPKKYKIKGPLSAKSRHHHPLKNVP